MIPQENAERLRKLIAVAQALSVEPLINEIFRQVYGDRYNLWLLDVANVTDGTYAPDGPEANKVINSYLDLINAFKKALAPHLEAV